MATINNIGAQSSLYSTLLNGLNSLNAVGSPLRTTPSLDQPRLLNASMNVVTISAFGRQINEINQSLKTIEDPNERATAMEGLRATMVSLTENPGGSKIFDFLASAEELRQTDQAAFQEMFTTAGTLSEGGYDLRGWIDAFVGIGDTALKKSFVSETDAIINNEAATPAQKQTTFDDFLKGVNDILSQYLDDEEFGDAMGFFLDELSQAESISDKSDALDRMREEGYQPAA